MDLFDAIMTRRSYRGEYLDAPVPRKHLQAIMEAGCAAPSGCNKQTASFIAVDDPELLGRLKALVTPPVAEAAPAWILVLTRPIVAYRDRRFNVQDYAAAIENMLLAIHALGYASCWYEGHITDDDDIAGRLAEALELPEDCRVVCLLPVGTPADTLKPPKKQPFDARMGYNRPPRTAQTPHIMPSPMPAGAVYGKAAQFHTAHGALRLRDKIDVLYGALMEYNGPVGRIAAHRRVNVKTLRQLGIDIDLRRAIRLLHKRPLRTLLSSTVGKIKQNLLEARKNTLPKSEGRVRLIFEDEAGFGRINKPKRCWCKKGMHHRSFMRIYALPDL